MGWFLSAFSIKQETKPTKKRINAMCKKYISNFQFFTCVCVNIAWIIFLWSFSFWEFEGILFSRLQQRGWGCWLVGWATMEKTGSVAVHCTAQLCLWAHKCANVQCTTVSLEHTNVQMCAARQCLMSTQVYKCANAHCIAHLCPWAHKCVNV